MRKQSLFTLTNIWLFLILPLTAAFIFRKSFGLGLYGDDWQHLYILWREFFVYHNKSFFDIRSYLNPYWPEYLYLGIIQHFWGYSPPAYFIASYLCRVFANIAIYFFSLKLTKSKLAAFLISLIFLFSAGGLQTTDWVFNMNTYFGLGLFLVACTIYLKIRSLKTFRSWSYLSFIITFMIALAVVPTRTHGAAPFLVTTELFLTFIYEKRWKIDRYFIVRTLIPILIFGLLIQVKSFGESSYTSGRLADSQKVIQQYTQHGYKDIYFYFLGILGHLTIPDNYSLDPLSQLVQLFLPSHNPFTATILTIMFLSIGLNIAATSMIYKKNKPKIYGVAILINILLAMFLKYLVTLNPNPSTNTLFSFGLGLQFIFWSVWLYFVSRKQYPLLSEALVVSLIWSFWMTLLYWAFTPNDIIETTGRYMTMGTAGFAIFLGSIITILIKAAMDINKNSSPDTRVKSSFYLIIPLMILIIWLGMNFLTTEQYFNIMYQNRNQELTNRTWNTLVQDVPKLDPTAPSVFYFTTDNPASLYGVLTYGFFMRAGLTWRIPVEALTPLPCTDYQELVEYVKTGAPLKRVHGRPQQPVPLSRIYAFDFRNGELTNITDLVRQQLIKDTTPNQ